MRTTGSAPELERLRRLAVDRVREGNKPAQVAQFLGLHPSSVHRWWRAYRKQGDVGLAAKPHPGRTPKLTPRRERQVLGWLRKNPKSFGFATELWTAPRIAQIIQRKWDVHFHPRYLNAWLTQRDITPQKPRTRPRERNDAVIQRWLRYQWPRIQNALAAWGRICCCSTKAASSWPRWFVAA
jgi:transposase